MSLIKLVNIDTHQIIIDNYKGNKSDPEYKLNGGDIMNKWLNNELGAERKTIELNKEIK